MTINPIITLFNKRSYSFWLKYPVFIALKNFPFNIAFKVFYSFNDFSFQYLFRFFKSPDHNWRKIELLFIISYISPSRPF